MARVTVEDCVDKVDSPYELVLVAKERATQLYSGIEPTEDQYWTWKKSEIFDHEG